jgi:hypothetical protein
VSGFRSSKLNDGPCELYGPEPPFSIRFPAFIKPNDAGQEVKSIENRIVRIKPLILILTASLLFFGCATPQQLVHFPDAKKVVEDTSKGRIYVIRPGWTGLGISTDISADGEIVGSTGPESYLCWEQEPGNVTISAKADNVSEVQVTVLAGQANYIIQRLHFGWVTTDNQLTVVSEAEGQTALKKCKPPTDDLFTNTASY